MSDYSAGLLALRFHENSLKQFLHEQGLGDEHGIIYPVNNRWIGWFLADGLIDEPETLGYVLEASNRVPLLHFFNAEDHAWGYAVYAYGAQRASGVFPSEVLTAEVGKPHDGASRPEQVQASYLAFRHFGLKNPQVAGLKKLFSNAPAGVPVSQFKQVVDLQEFKFMNYDHLIERAEEVQDVDDAESWLSHPFNADIARLVDSLVPLVHRFLRTGRYSLELMVERQDFMKVEFDFYDSLKAEDRDLYVRSMCISEIGNGVGRILYESHPWGDYHRLYNERFLPEKTGIQQRRWMEHGSHIYDALHDEQSSQCPRGKEAVAIVQRVVQEQFPQRELRPRVRKRVDMGYGFRGYEAYLFPRIEDDRDVLWVELDQANRCLNGGYGRADHDFFVGFGLPCWGHHMPFFGNYTTAEALEMTTTMFCRILAEVYPYHVELWKRYVD